MRLILVRHGQTSSNVAGALDTDEPGADLTELGRRQAAAVPGALADEDVTAVYASPLVRTQQTASPLAEARGLPVVVRRGLEEVSAGDLEMRTDEEAVLAYVDLLRSWMHVDRDRRLPGGEDGTSFLARFDAVVADLAEAHGPDDTVVVVSHGAAIRVWTAVATAMSPEHAAELHVSNTAAAVLQGSPDDGWELVSWTGDPLGGPELLDLSAHDVTGDDVED
ncbi:PE-PGRS family protein PE_PGRS11 [Nocardioides aquaticus]|uniref:PE-PGRS family protein PE_PGRS11 n=1 Tax=Nocardioides aquaticus TaxID=160826 RepID=A0ABX8EDU3_9ACTN|nr:histidine phosphatase family protein [Nocardioides aquaticus]QVT77746.1 PE-PGRS family protein PE_PGRS11 [Nocardioides aquaticus]